MAKLSKLLKVINQKDKYYKLDASVKDVLVYNANTRNEYYIDTRTIRNEDGVYVIKPIAIGENFYAYVCPYCQEIHVDGILQLVCDKKHVKGTQCRYSGRLLMDYIIDMPAAQKAIEAGNVMELSQSECYEYQKQWKFIKDFEENEDVDHDIRSKGKIRRGNRNGSL